MCWVPDWHVQRVERVLQNVVRVELVNLAEKVFNFLLSFVSNYDEFYSYIRVCVCVQMS